MPGRVRSTSRLTAPAPLTVPAVAGALTTITYDLLGMPMLPQALLSAYEVDAAWVHSISEMRVVLKRWVPGLGQACQAVGWGALG